jgi:hypothetical protein
MSTTDNIKTSKKPRQTLIINANPAKKPSSGKNQNLPESKDNKTKREQHNPRTKQRQ